MKILRKTVTLTTLCLTLILAQQVHAQQSNFFKLTDAFLQKNVDTSGNVDYNGIKQNRKELDQLVSIIASYDLSSASANEVKAFYTNTYNILVIKQIVDRLPIKGPLAVNGFFDKFKSTVAGEELTLNQVEKDKNLYVNKDERLHFAVVCGAKGCPPLANFAYTPEKIEQQLDERTRVSLNSEYFIRDKKNKTEVSQIFNWYKDDFKSKGNNGITSYLNKYRKKQIPLKTKIVYYEYDWNLNIQ